MITNIIQESYVYSSLINQLLFCQLLDISPKYFMFLKTFHSEFSYIEV